MVGALLFVCPAYRKNMRLRSGFFAVLVVLSARVTAAEPVPVETLIDRSYLDDYYSNVVYGYRIITQTEKYEAAEDALWGAQRKD